MILLTSLHGRHEMETPLTYVKQVFTMYNTCLTMILRESCSVF